MKKATRKLKTAGRLLRSHGFRAVLRYARRRYKYPYLRLLLRILPEATPLREPQVVQVEISSKCNLRCPSCSLGRDVATGRNMSYEEFSALLDRLPFRPDSVSLNGIGEALVNREIFRIVDLLEQRSISCSFYTNGTLLNERVRGEILQRSNIRFVGVSCDGASKETFEKLRYGAKFETWLTDVRAFVEGARRRRPLPLQVAMSTVLSRDNFRELRQLVELAADLGFEVIQLSDVMPHDEVAASMCLGPEEWSQIDREAVIAFASRLGVTASFTSQGKHPRPWLNCFQPWEYIQLSAEGDVLPCCAIMGSEKAPVMGNLHRESFESIWRGERFRHFRTTAARGSNEICNHCPYF